MVARTSSSRAARATAAVAEALGWERRRAARASRPTVVLGGAPNAGKSTLFNRLAEGDHAHVQRAVDFARGQAPDPLIAMCLFLGEAVKDEHAAAIAGPQPQTMV